MRVKVTYPLLTLKVIGAIHWHAVRLWFKGLKLAYSTHIAPRIPVTTVLTKSMSEMPRDLSSCIPTRRDPASIDAAAVRVSFVGCSNSLIPHLLHGAATACPYAER